MIGSLDKNEFLKELELGDKILIDIRTKEELKNFGQISEKQINYDFYQQDFVKNILSLDRNKKYLIYCWHGNRTKYVLSFMKENGFDFVFDLDGGIDVLN